MLTILLYVLIGHVFFGLIAAHIDICSTCKKFSDVEVFRDGKWIKRLYKPYELKLNFIFGVYTGCIIYGLIALVVILQSTEKKYLTLWK